MTKLEIYGAILIGLLLAFGGAYFKGRFDEKASIQKQELADTAAAAQRELEAKTQRAAADDKARAATENYIAAIDAGLSHARQQFASLPQTVVDARGCPGLSSSFGLRWNSVAALPGALGLGAGSAPLPMPAQPLPAAERPSQPNP